MNIRWIIYIIHIMIKIIWKINYFFLFHCASVSIHNLKHHLPLIAGEIFGDSASIWDALKHQDKTSWEKQTATENWTLILLPPLLFYPRKQMNIWYISISKAAGNMVKYPGRPIACSPRRHVFVAPRAAVRTITWKTIMYQIKCSMDGF